MSDINPENPQNYPNLKDMEGIILASEFTKENLKRERGSLLQKLNDVLSWYPDLQEFVSEKVRQDFTPILERKDFLIKEIARLEYLLQLNTISFYKDKLWLFLIKNCYSFMFKSTVIIIKSFNKYIIFFNNFI